MPVYPTGIGSTPIDYVSAGLNFFNSSIEQRLKDIQSKDITADKNEKRMLKAMSIQAIPELSGAMRDRYQVKIKDFKDKMVDTYSSKQGQLSIDDKKFVEENSIKLQNEMNTEKNWLDKYKSARDQMASPNFKKVVGDTDSYLSELQSMYERKMKGEDVEDPLSLMVKHRRQETPLEYLIGNSPKEIAALDQLVKKTVDTKTGQVITDETVKESAIEELFGNKFDTDPNFRNKFYVRDDNGAPVLDQTGKPTFDKEKIELELNNAKSALSKGKRIEDEYSFRNLMRVEKGARGGATGVRAYWSGKGDIGQVSYEQSTQLKDPSEITVPASIMVYDSLTGKPIRGKVRKGTVHSVVRKEGKPFIVMQYEGGGMATDKSDNIYYSSSKDAAFDPSKAHLYKTGATYEEDPQKAEGLLKGVAGAKYKDATFGDIKVDKQGDGSLKITGTATYKGKRGLKGEFPYVGKEQKTEEVEKTLYPMWDKRGKTEALMPLNRETASYLGKGDRKFMLADEGVTIEEYAVRQPLMNAQEVESVLFQKEKPKEEVVKKETVTYDIGGVEYTKETLIGQGYSEDQIKKAIDAGTIKVK